jgi:hypothetical protein
MRLSRLTNAASPENPQVAPAKDCKDKSQFTTFQKFLKGNPDSCFASGHQPQPRLGETADCLLDVHAHFFNFP